MDDRRLEAAFKMFDSNGDGVVTSQEIKNVIKRSSSALLDADFDKVCENIDKQYKTGIKSSEFKTIID
jgi:Ca2+-binding EF-hand superfamily protein